MSANSTLGVTLKTKKTGTGVTDTSKELSKLNTTVGGLKGTLGMLAGGTAIGAVTGALKFAITEAMEAERIMALTESTIKATGSAAGLTAQQVADMAGDLSLMTGIADDTIQSGQNMLLTFKEIKGDTFERATVAMNDMAVAMNGGSLQGLDLKATAIQLGKALNDPIKGVTALTKVGVTFTQAQKDAIRAMVDMGDTAGAQALILAELESEFGGAAEAAGETLAGSFAKLQNATSELAEEIGTKLLPPLAEAAKAALILIQWNDKIALAYGEQIDRVTETAETYGEYVDGVLAAAVAAGKLDQAWVNLHGEAVRNGTANANLTNSIGLMTTAQFKATKQVQAFDGAAYAAGWETMRLMRSQADAARGAEAAAERYQGLADALGVVGVAQFDLTNKLDDSKRAATLLAAALSGTITNAQQDYQDVISETTPEIERLTAQLARYQAAQGQTFTVTTAASASVEEYELAQIKAATAAQKLAEFTGDSREEYLELKIAADEAAGKVGTLGEQMGISQSFTADYTRQIMETAGSLDELNAKQAAAEEQLKRTTAEFIYQQIAANLDATAALEVGRTLGLVDEASYNTAKKVLDLTAKFDLNRDGMIDAAEATPQYLAALGYIQTSTVAAATGHSQNLTPAIQGTKDKMIDAAEAAQGYSDKLDGLNGKVVTATIITKLVTEGALPGISDNAGAGKAQANFASGTQDFIVPPGYPNDSYRVGLTSGEVVNVSPPGQSGNGGGSTAGVHIEHLTINAPGATANQLYDMLKEQDIRRRTGARS